MIKLLFATGFSCLAVGSICGYLISENSRSPSQSVQAQPVAPTPKTNRKELEDRYVASINKFNFRVDKADLVSLTDEQINNEVYRLETLLRAGKAYTKP
jgi:hypothetical protein